MKNIHYCNYIYHYECNNNKIIYSDVYRKVNLCELRFLKTKIKSNSILRMKFINSKLTEKGIFFVHYFGSHKKAQLINEKKLLLKMFKNEQQNDMSSNYEKQGK